MSKRLLSAVLVAVLTATACGRAPTSQTPSGGASRPSTAREVQGRLTLPPGTSLSPGNLRVVTAWGDGAVSQTDATSGTFTAVTVQGSAQLVMALDREGRVVLAGTSGIEDSLTLNSETTAESLLLINPVVATGDRNEALALHRHFTSNGYLGSVRDAVDQQLRTIGHINPAQDPLRTALLNAWNRLYQDIRSGALAQSSRSRVARQQSEPKPPSTRRSAITPEQDQSGIKLTEGEEADNDESTYELSLTNYRRRWLGLHARPYDSSGNPLGPWQFYGLTSARPGISLGSIVTGAVFNPSVKGYVVNLPQGTSTAKLEVWGWGFQDPASRPESDVALHLRFAPHAADMFFEFLLPAIAYILGLPGNLKAAFPDHVHSSQFVEVFYDTAAQLVALIGGDLSDFATTGKFSLTSSIASLGGFIRFLLDSPAGVRLLGFLIEQLAIEGFTGIALQVIQAAVRKVSPYLLFISTGELAANYVSVVWAYSNSRGVEFWTASLPRNPSWYFVATLNWDQPTDLDLYTTAPNGEVAWYGNRVISVGELDYDDTDGYGPENFTLRRKLVGRYRIDVDFYRYSRNTMPSSYRVVVTTRSGQQFPCRSGVLGAPGDRVVACFVDLDENGRVTVTPASNAAGVRPTDVGRDQVKPARR
jgi:hypothetical protein